MDRDSQPGWEGDPQDDRRFTTLWPVGRRLSWSRLWTGVLLSPLLIGAAVLALVITVFAVVFLLTPGDPRFPKVGFTGWELVQWAFSVAAVALVSVASARIWWIEFGSPAMLAMVVRDAHLQIPRRSIREGDRLRVQYEQRLIQPERAERARSLTISLVCREGSSRLKDDGEGGTYEEWDPSERTIQSFRDESPVPAAGNKLRAAWSFELPSGAGETSYIPDFRRKWVFRTKLDLRGWPDYSQEYEVVVAPPLPQRAEAPQDRPPTTIRPQSDAPLLQRSGDATPVGSVENTAIRSAPEPDQGASSRPATNAGTHLTRRAVDWYGLAGDTFPETRKGVIPSRTRVTPVSSVLNGWVRVRLSTGDEVWVVEDAIEPA